MYFKFEVKRNLIKFNTDLSLKETYIDIVRRFMVKL